jgi:hypothetical protein
MTFPATGKISLTSRAISRELSQLGYAALDRVSAGVAAGASLVHCQLLASSFYEALKIERHSRPPDGSNEEGRLSAALDECGRAANASLDPAAVPTIIGRTLSVLEDQSFRPAPRPSSRPALRVIQGGRAG